MQDSKVDPFMRFLAILVELLATTAMIALWFSDISIGEKIGFSLLWALFTLLMIFPITGKTPGINIHLGKRK